MNHKSRLAKRLRVTLLHRIHNPPHHLPATKQDSCRIGTGFSFDTQWHGKSSIHNKSRVSRVSRVSSRLVVQSNPFTKRERENTGNEQ
mmetsp:Transcript_23392/g.27067  ORF Transcript_23392/g.27067 Transcript_23392/m.27067 type:complete len:88 (+) Transcript_23392:72-335(+)